MPQVPKMLAARLFPKARYVLWLDSKLQLHAPPATLRQRFLPTGGGVVFAAYRNLKRDHIDEERDCAQPHVPCTTPHAPRTTRVPSPHAARAARAQGSGSTSATTTSRAAPS